MEQKKFTFIDCDTHAYELKMGATFDFGPIKQGPALISVRVYLDHISVFTKDTAVVIPNEVIEGAREMWKKGVK